MKPTKRYPLVNHPNILSTPTREIFLLPRKNHFKNQGTTERSEFDVANKNQKIRHHFGTKCR